MKRISILLCSVLCVLFAAGTAVAEENTPVKTKTKMGIANHLGLNVNVGTTGIGAELATPITPYLQARLGLHVMPGIKFHVDSDVSINTEYGTQDSEISLDGSLKRTQGSFVLNVYPMGDRFPLFIAVGAYFGGKDVVGINGYCPDIKTLGSYVEVGDYKLPLDENGYARGALRVNSFRPYIGIGTGRPCPIGRLNFMWELGVQFQKRPYLWDDINMEKIDLEQQFDSDDTFQKIMDKLTVYPVLKLTLSGRIF